MSPTQYFLHACEFSQIMRGFGQFHIKFSIKSYEPSHEKTCLPGLLTRSDSNQPAHLQNIYSYHKVLKFSDARKLCCNLPKIQTKKPNLRFWFALMLNVPVNNFSVMLGRSHRFLSTTSTFGG